MSFQINQNVYFEQVLNFDDAKLKRLQFDEFNNSLFRVDRSRFVDLRGRFDVHRFQDRVLFEIDERFLFRLLDFFRFRFFRFDFDELDPVDQVAAHLDQVWDNAMSEKKTNFEENLHLINHRNRNCVECCCRTKLVK